MLYRRQAEAVLSWWRQVEGMLEALPEGSAQAEALRVEAAELSATYQLLTDAAQRTAPRGSAASFHSGEAPVDTSVG